MKITYLLLISLLVVSCNYPDIDSVPDFNDIKLSKEEAIDLCNLSNTDSVELEKCLREIDIN